MLPQNHLERVFGHDMLGHGWQVDLPEAANDDDLYLEIDAAELLKLLKRVRR